MEKSKIFQTGFRLLRKDQLKENLHHPPVLVPDWLQTFTEGPVEGESTSSASAGARLASDFYGRTS